MKSSVYIETTVISYLTARPSRDLIVAAHQQITRDFWSEAPSRYSLFVSEAVVRECSAGDPTAAADRLLVLHRLQKLSSTDAAAELTIALLQGGAVPVTEPRDALHIAVAAVHGIQFLATWNFRHIANIDRRQDIDRICKASGFDPPFICSPDNLLGRYEDVD